MCERERKTKERMREKRNKGLAVGTGIGKPAGVLLSTLPFSFFLLLEA